MHDFMYDTEFLEQGHGHPIEFISIGMVHPASGNTYYAVNEYLPEREIKKNPWVLKNVWPYLPTTKNTSGGKVCRCLHGHLDKTHPDVKPRAQIAAELSVFIRTLGSASRSGNRLWAYYSSYDHVVLAQLYGRMIDLPEHIPMFTGDLKVEAERQGVSELPKQKLKEHHALADAHWDVDVARFLDII